jgi:protein-L-isoaspartate(D-aspartate) O-methyltransferase
MSDSSGDTRGALRHRMVEEQIRGRGIRDEHVTAVMASLPRHEFVPPEQASAAYEDRALPIGLEQTISQPYMVAAMTAALHLDRAHRVLEIGTGSGYQTAILAAMAGDVFTIERIAPLSERAQALLGRLGYTNIRFRVGDGSLGWPELAPFDRILVTAGAPEIPEPLVGQLAAQGRLIVPVGRGSTLTLKQIDRNPNGKFEHSIMSCRFVPLIGAAGWPEDNVPPGEE